MMNATQDHRLRSVFRKLGSVETAGEVKYQTNNIRVCKKSGEVK